MEKIKLRFAIAFLATITLGLAPFNPPHIWSKVVLISRGEGAAFNSMDWFDVLLHGSPWLLLIVFGVQFLIKKKAESNDSAL